jgi:hypothetical protein
LKPVGVLQVPLENFNHLDFMWANEVKKYVYDPLIEALKSGSGKMQRVAAEQQMSRDIFAQALKKLCFDRTVKNRIERLSQVKCY